MADRAVTAAQVKLMSGQPITGKWGATVVAGNGVYYDKSTDKWKLADANVTIVEAGQDGLGIALNGGADGQEADIAGPGCDVDMGAGAAMLAGELFVVSATAGAIAPTADISTSGHFRSVLCVGKGSQRVRVIARAAEAAIP